MGAWRGPASALLGTWNVRKFCRQYSQPNGCVRRAAAPAWKVMGSYGNRSCMRSPTVKPQQHRLARKMWSHVVNLSPSQQTLLRETLHKGELLLVHTGAKVLNEVKHWLEALYWADVFTYSHYVTTQPRIRRPIVLRPGAYVVTSHLQNTMHYLVMSQPLEEITTPPESRSMNYLLVQIAKITRFCK